MKHEKIATLLAQTKQSIISIQKEALIIDVVKNLSKNNIGVILVVNQDGSLDGIVSERDIIHAIANRDSVVLGRTVEEIMTGTHKVTTCNTNSYLDDTMRLMTEGHFRHIPVLENDKVVGILSLADIVKARLTEVEDEAATMRDMISS
ncbi:MAG: CBS domain-containing protein [Magnetococcales bacterium]|nr:CBS domain-containing protein [Magnetococcales bacterium]